MEPERRPQDQPTSNRQVSRWFPFLSAKAVGFLSSLFFKKKKKKDEVTPKQQCERFIDEFELAFGHTHPKFFLGSFKQACEAAKREAKFLLIYFHCDDHDNTADFCRNTFSTEAISSLINTGPFLVWGCSVSHSEGRLVSELVQISTFPSVAVLCRNNRGDMTRVDLLEGPLKLEEFRMRLNSVIEIHSRALFEMNQRVESSRNPARSLREEQDLEFQQTLIEDQLRENQKREQQRLEKLEEERKEKEKELIERKRIEKLKQVGEEPPSGPGVCELNIRLPNGSRKMRRFLISDRIQRVLDYVEHLQPDLQSGKWEICSHFPRVVYGDPNKTLQEVALIGKQSIFVEEKV